MARIRTIKPQFFMNEEMAGLDPLTRLLFVGLWTLADKEGRMEDRPRRIKAEILPYDDHDVDVALSALSDCGFILRYSDAAGSYLQISNFKKHQRINGSEADIESSIPAPGEHSGSTEEALGKHSGSTEEALRKHSGRQEGRKERKGKEGTAREENPEPVPDNLSRHSFARFKDLMPLRNGKFLDEGACSDKWARAPAQQNQWIAAVRNYRESEEVRSGAVCSPMKFLTSKWRDWLTPEKPTGAAEDWKPDLSWKQQQEEDLRMAREWAEKKAQGEKGVIV